VDGQFTYQDFDLLIEPGSDDSYRARVLRSPAGESGLIQFTLPFSAVELENLVLKVGRGRRRARGGRPESQPLKDFGGKLYGAVFQDELRDMLQRSLSLTHAEHIGMRLRLRLIDAPELANLPWEFLYDPRHKRFLAQSRRTPLVRYLDLPEPPHTLSVEGPLRLLVMISNPSGYEPLDVEKEWEAVTSALAQRQAEGRVVVERLPANMRALRARLRREEFHVLHFIGHGFYKPDWGDGVLVMEDRDGLPHEVLGEDLGGLLNEYDQMRLAVLNACEGARNGASDPFAGIAQSLIQQGLPAVVAMQFEITDQAAIIFARELYAAIADSYPLEAALAEARGAIRDEGNLIEWGTPVLYSRAPDGRLFDLTGPGRISDADRQAREDADRQAREDADRQAREDADRQAREDADRQAREDADRQAREDADRQAREDARVPVLLASPMILGIPLLILAVKLLTATTYHLPRPWSLVILCSAVLGWAVAAVESRHRRVPKWTVALEFFFAWFLIFAIYQLNVGHIHRISHYLPALATLAAAGAIFSVSLCIRTLAKSIRKSRVVYPLLPVFLSFMAAGLCAAAIGYAGSRYASNETFHNIGLISYHIGAVFLFAALLVDLLSPLRVLVRRLRHSYASGVPR